MPGFGGDGGGGFAAKVGFGELRPKVFEGLRVAGELGFGLFARAVFAGVQAVLVVFELVPGLLVEVVEEAGAPGVPEAGVGGADVGGGSAGRGGRGVRRWGWSRRRRRLAPGREVFFCAVRLWSRWWATSQVSRARSSGGMASFSRA